MHIPKIELGRSTHKTDMLPLHHTCQCFLESNQNGESSTQFLNLIFKIYKCTYQESNLVDPLKRLICYHYIICASVFWNQTRTRNHQHFIFYCMNQDSNLDAFTHWCLKPAGLPFPHTCLCFLESNQHKESSTHFLR